MGDSTATNIYIVSKEFTLNTKKTFAYIWLNNPLVYKNCV